MNNRRVQLIAVWISGLAFALMLHASELHAWQVNGYLIGLLSICTALVVGPGDILFYTSWFITMEFGVKPLVLYYYPQIDIAVANLHPLWSHTLFFQLLAYGVFVIGYALASKPKAELKIIEYPIPTKWFLIMMYLVIWLARLVEVHYHVTNSIVGQLGNLSPLVVASGTVLAIKKHKSDTYLFVAMLVVGDVVWSYLSKTKLVTMLDIICVLYFFAHYRRVRMRYLILAPVVSVLFIGAIEVYRAPSVYGNMNWISAGIMNLVQRSDNFDTALRVFTLTPASIPFWGGQMLLALFETAIIPFPFPGKIYMPVGNLVAQYYYEIYNPNVYIAFGLGTSWYVTLGTIGAIVAMFIMGLLIGLVFRYCFNLLHRGWFAFGLLVSALIAFSDIEQSYFDQIDHFVKGGLLALLFAMVWAVMRKSIQHFQASTAVSRMYD